MTLHLQIALFYIELRRHVLLVPLVFMLTLIFLFLATKNTSVPDKNPNEYSPLFDKLSKGKRKGRCGCSWGREDFEGEEKKDDA